MRLLLVFAALPLCAAVDGTVINQTTGRPQAGATVTLYKLGGAGMEALESVKSDATGKFKIEQNAAGGPHLLQAAFEGVTYNKMLPPGSPTSGVEVQVYQSAATPAHVAVKQHVFILEPARGKLQVAENIIYENKGTRTYNDPVGSVRFTLPAETQGKARVMCEGPNSMPIERTPKLIQGNVYAINFPVKPGETRIQATYEVPLGDPPVWAVDLLHKEGDTRLATPSGVTLKGDGIKEIGREPRSQAVIYEATTQKIRATVEGSGAIPEPTEASQDDAPGIQEINPRIYDRIGLVMGLAGSILALTFALVYRRSGTGG
jgi:hypothetical protein